MKVEITIEDAVDAYVAEIRGNRYRSMTIEEITDLMDKLLDTSRSYEDAAQIIYNLLDRNKLVKIEFEKFDRATP